MVTFELRFPEISIQIKIEVKIIELIMHKASQNTNTAKPLSLRMKELQTNPDDIQELHLAKQCDHPPSLKMNRMHWFGMAGTECLSRKKSMIAKDDC